MRRPIVSPVVLSTIILSAVLLGKPRTLAAGLTQTNKYFGSLCQVLSTKSTAAYKTKTMPEGTLIEKTSAEDTAGIWEVFCPVTVSTTTQTPFKVQNLTFSIVVVPRAGGSPLNVIDTCHGVVETPSGEKIIDHAGDPDANKYDVDRAHYYCDIPNTMDIYVESFNVSMQYVNS